MAMTLPAQRLPQPREFVRGSERGDSPFAILVAGLATILLGHLIVATLLETATWAVVAAGAAGLVIAARVPLNSETRAVRWVTVTMSASLVLFGSLGLVAALVG